MALAAKISIPKMKETSASKVRAVYNDTNSRNSLNSNGDSSAEHGDSEGTWIFSYADMITILMMFFILLLSISSLDVQKFEQLKGAMVTSKEQKNPTNSNGSGGETRKDTNPGNTNVARYTNEPSVGNVPIKLLVKKASEFSASDNNTQLIAAIQTLMDAVDVKAMSKTESQTKRFQEIRKQLADMKNIISDEEAIGGKKNQEIKITLISGDLFTSSDALSAKGQSLVVELANSILALDPFPQVGIASFLNPQEEPDEKRALGRSNNRAMAIFDLFKKNRVNPNLMSVSGYGTARALLNEKDSYGNTIATAQKNNSRIEISIVRRKDFKK